MEIIAGEKASDSRRIPPKTEQILSFIVERKNLLFVKKQEKTREITLTPRLKQLSF